MLSKRTESSTMSGRKEPTGTQNTNSERRKSKKSSGLVLIGELLVTPVRKTSSLSDLEQENSPYHVHIGPSLNSISSKKFDASKVTAYVYEVPLGMSMSHVDIIEKYFEPEAALSSPIVLDAILRLQCQGDAKKRFLTERDGDKENTNFCYFMNGSGPLVINVEHESQKKWRIFGEARYGRHGVACMVEGPRRIIVCGKTVL